jgi:hypothetical protein
MSILLLKINRGKDAKFNECGTCLYRCLNSCDIWGLLNTNRGAAFLRLSQCIKAEEALMESHVNDKFVSAIRFLEKYTTKTYNGYPFVLTIHSGHWEMQHMGSVEGAYNAVDLAMKLGWIYE